MSRSSSSLRYPAHPSFPHSSHPLSIQLREQQVMLFWHLGTLLLHLAPRIDWKQLPPKPRRRLRPLLRELHSTLEQARAQIAARNAPEEINEEGDNDDERAL